MLLLSISGLTLTAAAQEGPQTVTFSAVADTYVCDFPGFTDENQTATRQFIQVLHIGTSNCHGFFRFDLTPIFAGSTIISANLSLHQVAYVWDATEEQNITAYGTAVGWSEVTMVFAVWDRDPRDQPVTGVTRPTNNATTGTRVNWNVTPLVDSWVQDVLPAHGFRLGRTSGDGTTNFASREALEVANRPILTVTYLRIVPADPSVHPLAPFVVQLGVPVDLFLSVVGIALLVLVYFGLYAAHNPELVGRKKRQKPSIRSSLRAFRRRR